MSIYANALHHKHIVFSKHTHTYSIFHTSISFLFAGLSQLRIVKWNAILNQKKSVYPNPSTIASIRIGFEMWRRFLQLARFIVIITEVSHNDGDVFQKIGMEPYVLDGFMREYTYGAMEIIELAK